MKKPGKAHPVKSTNQQILLSTIFLLLFFSCKPHISTVIFHSDMGKMTVSVSRNLSDDAAALLEAFLASSADSLAIDKVLHDGFIQMNFQTPALKSGETQDGMPLRGAFVWSGGRFYIVQGREHTDASLNKWEQLTGRKIPQTSREQYKKHGGALQFEGKCLVIGTLVSGKEVLDRIAALPSNADGRPLRPLPVQVACQK
jgi:hypothetical protein